jgi:hypothetical protein
MNSERLIAGLATAFTLAAVTPVEAATPLAWSLAGGNISACKAGTPCVAGNGRRIIHNVANYGYSENNGLDLAGGPFGRVEVTTSPGAGDFALPQLRAAAFGGAGAGNEFARSLAFSDAVQRYRWDGDAGIDLSTSLFVGSLHLSNTGTGRYHAALNIIDSTLDDSVANGDYWYYANSFLYGGASAGCSSPGAIASSDTGTVIAPFGESNVTLTPNCGASTFHLDPGEEFFVWARLDLLHFGSGATNALNTFKVELSPDTPDEVVQALSSSLTVLPTYSPFAVPEPSTWALLILGFGAIGANLRRSAPRTQRRLQSNAIGSTVDR